MEIPNEVPKFHPLPKQSVKATWYVIASPRFESEGVKLFGTFTLLGAKNLLRTLAKDYSGEDNYHFESVDTIYDIVEINR